MMQMIWCTFVILLSVLQPAVTCENTRLYDCIIPEKALTLGLYLLVYRNFYEGIGWNFSFGRCCGGPLWPEEWVSEVSQQRLKPRFASRHFKMFLISQTLSVEYIDRSYIQVASPPYSAVSYFRLQSTTQLHCHYFYLVDGRKCFLDFASGFPGRIQDARVQRNSTIVDLASLRISNFISNTFLVPCKVIVGIDW